MAFFNLGILAERLLGNTKYLGCLSGTQKLVSGKAANGHLFMGFQPAADFPFGF